MFNGDNYRYLYLDLDIKRLISICRYLCIDINYRYLYVYLDIDRYLESDIYT